jgi:branched-chain amino acid transport system permease protein
VTAIASPQAPPNPINAGLRLTGIAAIGVGVYLVVLWLALAASGRTIEAALPEALQQTVNALSIGAIYALIALGYTMVYGIIELINFAHGDIFMLGAFMSVVFIGGITGNNEAVHNLPLLALLILGALAFAMPIIGLVNVTIERVVYRPLRNAPRLAPLITAVGVSFILQNVALTIAGSGDRKAPQIFPLDAYISVGGAQVSVLSIFIFVMAMALMLLLQVFVRRTRLGRAMRATAQDREASALMGVDANQTIALTFLIGGVLAAAAGVVWGLRFGYVRFDLGFNSGLKAFTAAVLGGIGNITGAVIGGFIIGFIENFSAALGFARWSEFLVFAILTLVLLFRPTGILGVASGDRA